MKSIAFIMTIANSMLSCGGDAVTFATLESDCRNSCNIAVDICDADVADPEESEAKCVEYCSEELRMRADEHSDVCAVAYEQMMVCVGTLKTCDEYYNWGGRESNNLCKPESEIFDHDCEGY
jgi:hypothetical protein